MTERAVARHGYPVVKDGAAIGVVTSGSYGPSVDKYVAMAYVATPARRRRHGAGRGDSRPGQVRPDRPHPVSSPPREG